MLLETLDWIIIIAVFIITMGIGIMVSRQSGQNSTEYFLSGRRLPWWLLGMSMVATTFSTDTPNLVTSIVRQNGVSGNWVWWAFLLTGMLTVFVYAKLWRKSGVKTDLEFYNLRYGGAPANFLRGFRAIYLGVIFNVFAMSGVTLAAIKIAEVMLGIPPEVTVLVASTITVIFSALGGFKGVVYTDIFLFFLAMIGAFASAFYLLGLPEVGGLSGLLSHPNVAPKLALVPSFDDKEMLIMLLIIPLAVQWWSSWYPGAEPGGGGYVAQRMLAAKNEQHAIGATFLFNVMHYALRPWPWILVALASLIYFPELSDIQNAFPEVADDKLGDDLGYSAMLTMLPAGLAGIVIASLISAYMSTISTHLNWGASYLVHDFYKQYLSPDASEKEMVRMGRIVTLLLMVLSAGLALFLQDAYQLFKFILAFGAGTGLIFILRWFWWRINAWSEISAMISSGLVSLLFLFPNVTEAIFGDGLEGWAHFPLIVLISTIIWVSTTFLTKPESEEVLVDFYKKIQPGGPGWSRITRNMDVNDLDGKPWAVPKGIVLMLLGCVFVYALLFAIGNLIYGEHVTGSILMAVSIIAVITIIKMRPTVL